MREYEYVCKKRGKHEINREVLNRIKIHTVN